MDTSYPERKRASSTEWDECIFCVLHSISFSSQAPWWASWAIPLTPRSVDPYETWCDSLQNLPPVPDSKNQALLSLTWPKSSATTWHIHNQFFQLLGKVCRVVLTDTAISQIKLCLDSVIAPGKKCPNREAKEENQQT